MTKSGKRKKVKRSTIKKLQRVFAGYEKARKKEKKWFKQLQALIGGKNDDE